MRGHGFVLDGYPPNRNSLRLVRFNEFDEVVRPGLLVAWQEFATPQHVVVGFHEGRRAPGARIKNEVIADDGRSSFDHWDPLHFVLLNGKCSQCIIAFFDVRMASKTKITAVNAGPDDVVIDSIL